MVDKGSESLLGGHCSGCGCKDRRVNRGMIGCCADSIFPPTGIEWDFLGRYCSDLWLELRQRACQNWFVTAFIIARKFMI